MGKIEKYASTLEELKDSRFQVNGWNNLNDAVGNTGLSATSTYAVKDNVNFVPSQLYAHDFDINLPDQYIIHSINVEVKIKGSVTAKVPRCYFIWGIGTHSSDGSFGSDVFSVQPNTNISDSFNTINYGMNWSEVIQYKMTDKKLETDLFGVILQFNEPIQKTSGSVAIEWIKLTIDYEEPEYQIEILSPSFTYREDLAKYLYKQPFGSFLDVTIKVHSTNSHIIPTPKSVHIDIPLGLHLYDYEEGYGVSFNPNTHDLSVDWSTGTSPYIKLTLWGRYAGLKKLSVIGNSKIGTVSKWTFIDKGTNLGADDDVLISSGIIRRWEESDFHFVAKIYSEDGTAGFVVWLDESKNSDYNELVAWKLDESKSSAGVTLNESVCNYNYVGFNVPRGQEVVIHWTGTFLPKTVGANTLTVESDAAPNFYEYDYVSLEPYDYVFKFLNHDIHWGNARVVSQIETGAYVYDIGVSDFDAMMVQDKATLNMQQWDNIDYIGCVALEQTHFDPKSTYKDTLLDTNYKNKRYMGKKGVLDETITLNVRLHPYQVTTIQGLIAMDKPVPINTNHLAFEGDSLNHRGWAELYGITSELTNPHWYKCNLSVKYITHNLHTRFSINKGSRISDYFLPELMSTVHDYGDDITEDFYIETNGGYIYKKNATDFHMRNMLTLPYGKRFKIKGMNKLSIKSQVNFNWYSTRNIENTHNNVSRIIKLVDAETGNAVLEYEYYDVDFSRTYEYSCRVICRVLHKGAYKTILNRNLVLNYDAEYNPSEAGGLALYGSELIFKINSDRVTIQDCGMSGKELYIEDIDIQNGMYYFDVEFTNNNMQHDSPDISNFVDVQIQELDYTSIYSNYYKNLLVSPFPVPGKDVVFTRDSEEGTIYYLLDDGTECTYMVNPYYQYHCGVDLQSKDKISIFNIDNNYQTVYIVNGLIKLGINRYNGRLTLYKYDKYSKDYILVSKLQLIKYEDMNINSFTDDKLELQVSDTIITVWRGRPYIHFAHETEDILFDNKFIKVYADGVGDSVSDMTKLWSLIDTTNLLPSCIASHKHIDASCWNISESNVSDWSPMVTIQIDYNGGLANPSIIGADCHYDVEGDKMFFLINGEAIEGTREGTAGTANETHRVTYKFTTAGTYEIRAVYIVGDNYYLSNKVELEIEDNAYHITPTFPSTMYYMQNDFTAKLTYATEPVGGETIVFYVNGLSYPKITDEDGIARLNNRLPPNAESEGRSQDYDGEDTYFIHMTYSEGGDIVASAEKDTKILKGSVNIDLKTYDKNGTQLSNNTVKQHGYVLATFTNNLDPEDDDIEEGEIYLKNKAVVISVNGRDYPRITDANGQARLNINLLPQNYDLRVTFGGDNQYNGTIKNYEIIVVEDN